MSNRIAANNNLDLPSQTFYQSFLKGHIMQYMCYGKNGPQISRLGFGVMRLPEKKTGGVHFPKSVSLLKAAMEAGVNFFDSHHNYHEGNSEVAIGKALKGWKGQKIYIQTKTPWYAQEKREFFEKKLYEALEKLGVNTIDYLFHHSLSMPVWEKKGKQFIKFTDWAMNRGLIRHRGFSSHSSVEDIKQFVDTGEFSAMLVSFNWANPYAREAIYHAADKGMGVTVMNPVGGGSLAASVKKTLRLLPGAKTAAEVGLRFALGTKGVTGALSGMSTLGQLEENVAIASRRTVMTPKQIKNMTRKLNQTGRKLLCSECGYCMPCPHGVKIPQNLALHNKMTLFGQVFRGKHQFATLKKNNASALSCTKCRKCLPKCPNKIPIIRRLRETSEMFDARPRIKT